MRQAIYLIPLVIFLIVLFKYGNKCGNRIKKNKVKPILQKILNLFLPKKNSKLYNKYFSFLSYSRISVEKFFIVKAVIAFFVLIFLLLIHLTNVYIEKDIIYNEFNYKTDIVYNYDKKDMDKDLAMEEEKKYFEKILEKIKLEDMKIDKESIQTEVLKLIGDKKTENNKYTIANKIYYRVKDSIETQKINYIIILFICVIAYFMPDIIISVRNSGIKKKAKKELLFLKKIVILNGSIKPVNFEEILDILVEKSKIYKKLLKSIRSDRNKNRYKKENIYKMHINKLKSLNDLDLKFFLEKLEQADNYNFDIAIKNIETDFRVARRERAREVKKTIEFLDIIGMIGSMFLITILTVYLLIPWLSSYDMSTMF